MLVNVRESIAGIATPAARAVYGGAAYLVQGDAVGPGPHTSEQADVSSPGNTLVQNSPTLLVSVPKRVV